MAEPLNNNPFTQHHKDIVRVGLQNVDVTPAPGRPGEVESMALALLNAQENLGGSAIGKFLARGANQLANTVDALNRLSKTASAQTLNEATNQVINLRATDQPSYQKLVDSAVSKSMLATVNRERVVKGLERTGVTVPITTYNEAPGMATAALGALRRVNRQMTPVPGEVVPFYVRPDNAIVVNMTSIPAHQSAVEIFTTVGGANMIRLRDSAGSPFDLDPRCCRAAITGSPSVDAATGNNRGIKFLPHVRIESVPGTGAGNAAQETRITLYVPRSLDAQGNLIVNQVGARAANDLDLYAITIDQPTYIHMVTQLNALAAATATPSSGGGGAGSWKPPI